MIRQNLSVLALAIAFVACSLAEIGRAGTWEQAAPTNVTREYPGLALMGDGKVLAVSGHPLKGKSLASAELYDPVGNVWTPTGALHVARNGVEPGGLLKLPNGKFLLAGGGTANRSVHEVELYDYKTGTWELTGSMDVPRCVHSATQLAAGDVLVVGGIDWITEQVHASAEVYNVESGQWMKTGSMATPRFNHRAVRLPDGCILVTGGNSSYPSSKVVASAEIYDPRTGAWRETAPMLTARRVHAAISLADGRVLVAGGSSGAERTDKQLSSAEVFDPKTEAWTSIAALKEARWGPTASLLRNGHVLVTGGAVAPLGARKSAEIFLPDTGEWRDAGTLQQARNGHRAILLKDGRVLIVGGHYLGKYLASCELYTP